MGVQPAGFDGVSAEFGASTTAEMLAALPDGLMVNDGGSPAERRVADVLALYRAVFLNAADPIAIVDANGRYLEQNAAHQLLLGYSGDELRGKTPAMHLGEETFASIAAELRANGACQREVATVTKDGLTRIVVLSTFAVRDRTGRAACFVDIKRDVTEERRAAAELRRRLEELDALYRVAGALARACAPEEIFDEAIEGMLRAVGADRASVLLFDDDGVMRFRAWHGLSEEYRRAVEGHSPWTRETRDPQPVTVADVTVDPHLAALAPVITGEGIRALAFVPLLDDGELIGKFMLYCDAPHRWTDAEIQLASTVASHVAFAIQRHRREDELRIANRTKAIFLATMSHELRTPLNAIAGYTDLIDAGVHGELTPAMHDAISRIQVNQRHLLGLIDDVLDFAKLEAGHLSFDIGDVPVQDMLEVTRAMVEPQMRARGMHVEFGSGDPAITCRGDRAKVQQILVNLMSNASKFTAPGGTVTLRWEATADEVRFHVSDTGAGIPVEHLETIFAPFVQLHQGFRRRVEGTGLGLAISRELARGMGGDILASSAVGKGSTFTLSLRRRED